MWHDEKTKPETKLSNPEETVTQHKIVNCIKKLSVTRFFFALTTFYVCASFFMLGCLTFFLFLQIATGSREGGRPEVFMREKL